MDNRDNRENRNRKAHIFFARTYRRLKPCRPVQFIYLVALIVPCLIAFLLFYPQLTDLMCRSVIWVFERSADTPGDFGIAQSDFLPYLGQISYITAPTKLPDFTFTLVNLAIVLALFVFCVSGRRRGRPLAVFMTMCLLIQIASCIYFLFAAAYFPYTATEYSLLYMQKQIGIWLFLIIVTGTVVALIGRGNVIYKLATYLGVLAYGLVFGCVRYVTFMYVICRFSSLYMATMYFTLGPLFDFMYLVYIYGLYVGKASREFDSGRERGIWQWT